MERKPFDRSFDNLENLADAISDELKCSVTIEDNNHRLLAYSSHDSITDQVRIATIIGRRVPDKVIQVLWQEGVIQTLLDSDVPIRISAIPDIGLGDRLAIAVRKNSIVLGYIWLQEVDRQLDAHSLAHLVQAAQAAKTKLLQLKTKDRKEEQGYQDFFWQLITGHYKSDQIIKEKADSQRIQLPSSFQITILQFESEITEELTHKIQYMLNANQRFQVTFHIFRENQLILLFATLVKSSPDNNQDVLFHLCKEVEKFLDCSLFNIGVGCRYKDYTMTEKSYLEALTVLKINRQFPEETKHIIEYSDLGFYRFLPMIQDEKRNHHVESKSIQRLTIYDKEQNSNLLYTLKTFLYYDSNIKKAAEVLFIHTNTLVYRLKRIAEVGGIDLNNADSKVSLYLEFKSDVSGNPN